MGDGCVGEIVPAGNSTRVILFDRNAVHLQFSDGCMIFFRHRTEQALDIFLRDDPLSRQSGEYAFAEPKMQLRLVF